MTRKIVFLAVLLLGAGPLNQVPLGAQSSGDEGDREVQQYILTTEVLSRWTRATGALASESKRFSKHLSLGLLLLRDSAHWATGHSSVEALRAQFPKVDSLDRPGRGPR